MVEMLIRSILRSKFKMLEQLKQCKNVWLWVISNVLRCRRSMLKNKEIGGGHQRIYIHQSMLVQMQFPVNNIHGRQVRIPIYPSITCVEARAMVVDVQRVGILG